MSGGLFLVNYRCNGVEPLRSITRLARDEALKVAAELYALNQCSAHRRFGPDFPNYFDFHLKTEKWLYESFIALGGKPVKAHPLYFALECCESLKRNFGSSEELRIPLSGIDEAHVSFTFGDSVAISEHPESRKPVFTKRELHKAIDAAGGIDIYLKEINKAYPCIEAQLWSDEYALKALSERRNC